MSCPVSWLSHRSAILDRQECLSYRRKFILSPLYGRVVRLQRTLVEDKGEGIRAHHLTPARPRRAGFPLLRERGFASPTPSPLPLWEGEGGGCESLSPHPSLSSRRGDRSHGVSVSSGAGRRPDNLPNGSILQSSNLSIFQCQNPSISQSLNSFVHCVPQMTLNGHFGHCLSNSSVGRKGS